MYPGNALRAYRRATRILGSMREQAHRQGRPELSPNMPQGIDFA